MEREIGFLCELGEIAFLRPILFCLFILSIVFSFPENCSSSSPGNLEAGKVIVVYCIDTETDGFNYYKLHQTLNLNAFVPNNIIDHTFDLEWRGKLTDSFGNALRISWYLMTFEGYRGSPDGIGSVVNAFVSRFGDKVAVAGDCIGWHYHHGDWSTRNSSRASWQQIETFDGSAYNTTTDRQLALDHLAVFIYASETMPSTFRAGWIWENTDFSNWLDSLIPFDYSHNWDSVSTNQFMYHPSHKDMYQEGHSQRIIIRCVDRLDSAYVLSIFEQAAKGEDVILAHYTHNYGSTITRNNAIKRHAELYHKLTEDLSEQMNVEFSYMNAIDAANFMTTEQYSCDSAKMLEPILKVTADALYLYNAEMIFGVPVACIPDGTGHIRGYMMEFDEETVAWLLEIQNINVENAKIAFVDCRGIGRVVHLDN